MPGAFAVSILVTDDTPLHAAHRLQPWSEVKPLRLRQFAAEPE
jgi:hypothetical protein